MALVDDVDLVARRSRLELHRLYYRLYVVHLVVGGGIELRDIQRMPCSDFATVNALTARLHSPGRLAVKRFGEDSRQCRLADSARADEQICVGDAFCLDGMAQSIDDMLLADDVVKRHRTIL